MCDNTPQFYPDNTLTSNSANINDTKSFRLKKCSSDDALFATHKETISFIDPITEAINKSTDQKLTLSEIYNWIEKNMFDLFNENTRFLNDDWKDLVLQTLSTNSCFTCIPDKNLKNSWWLINSEPKSRKKGKQRRTASIEEENNLVPAKQSVNMLKERNAEIVSTSANLNEFTLKYPASLEEITSCKKDTVHLIELYGKNGKLVSSDQKVKPMLSVLDQAEQGTSDSKNTNLLDLQFFFESNRIIDKQSTNFPDTLNQNDNFQFHSSSLTNVSNIHYKPETNDLCLSYQSQTCGYNISSSQIESKSHNESESSIIFESENSDHYYKELKESGCNALASLPFSMCFREQSPFHSINLQNTNEISDQPKNTVVSVNRNSSIDHTDESEIDMKTNGFTIINKNIDEDSSSNDQRIWCEL